MSSKSLLDLMPKEEAQKALERANKRLTRNKTRRGHDISPEIYLVSEMGYYFGWEAVLSIRRGYTVEANGDKQIFTLEEAQVLLEGARKVWYSKLVEQAHAGVISNTFNSGSKSFSTAVEPFTEKAEVKE